MNCPDCDGTGQAEPHCDVCNGSGWEPDPSDGGTMTCTGCRNDKCETCDGEGTVEVRAA